MRALISDGGRGLTPPVYPLESRRAKSIKTQTRSAGDDEGRARLFPFRSLSADLLDLFCYLYLPAPSRNDVPRENRACNTVGGGGATRNSNYVLQWSTTDETGAGGAPRPQDTSVRTVQPEGRKKKSDRDTLMRRQLEPGTQRHIWTLHVGTNSD